MDAALQGQHCIDNHGVHLHACLPSSDLLMLHDARLKTGLLFAEDATTSSEPAGLCEQWTSHKPA